MEQEILKLIYEKTELIYTYDENGENEIKHIAFKEPYDVYVLKNELLKLFLNDTSKAE
jgi:transcriptional regulator